MYERWSTLSITLLPYSFYRKKINNNNNIILATGPSKGINKTSFKIALGWNWPYLHTAG